MDKKKIVCFRLLLALSLCMFLSMPLTAAARAAVPYGSWTQGPGGMTVGTQTAYIPEQVILADLNGPEDLFVDDDGSIYICDTGNGRVVILHEDGTSDEIGGEALGAPTGIHVNKNFIYIVDYEKQKVLLYDKDLNPVSQIEKPKEAIFGDKTKFMPRKVLADQRGNVYVLSEGSTAGLMQFNPSGVFLGYFGSNNTANSLVMRLQRTFFTEEQLNKLFKSIPPSVTNMSIDSQGLIYTVTAGESDYPLKKLNISGKNLYPPHLGDVDVLDVAVDENGSSFIVTAKGYISEFDSYGRLLFGFGGKDNDKERMGVLSEPAAIDVDKNGKIYVLDKAKNCIFQYNSTSFSDKVHQGIAMYKDGRYEESQEIWNEIRKMNSSFIQSYDALAKADYKKQNYGQALSNYRIAENKEGYSQAYWMLRNEWLKKYAGVAVAVIVVFILIWQIIKRADKRTHFLAPLQQGYGRFRSIPFVSGMFFVKRMLKAPVDGYYELKFQKKATVLTATVWYIWLFVLQLTGIYAVSYLFDYSGYFRVNLGEEFLKILLPVFLWVSCNYLVSTITEGEGKLRDIYCGTAYALAPYLVFAFPLQLLTHLLTNNEAFIYSFGMFALVCWSVVLFVLMVKQIHDYTLFGTIKNILVTLFTIILFLLAAFIMYLLFRQLRDFIISIVQEVSIRG